MKRSVKSKALILAGAMALALPLNAMAVVLPSPSTIKTVKSEVNLTGKLIKSRPLTTDWEVAALAKANLLTNAEKTSYLATVKTRVSKQALKGTDLEKTIIVLRALGQDPQNYDGHNLIKQLYSDPSLSTLTDYTYALIALDTAGYVIPANALWTRDRLAHKIVSLQAPKGGWGWAGNSTPDPDTTGIVLEALSKHRHISSVNTAVINGANYLKRIQKSDGGWDNWKLNSCSAAEVVIGLTANGLDPANGAFNNKGKNPLTFIHSFELTNGAYKWLLTDKSENVLATDEVFQALVSEELLANKDSLFSFQFPKKVTKVNSVRK